MENKISRFRVFRHLLLCNIVAALFHKRYLANVLKDRYVIGLYIPEDKSEVVFYYFDGAMFRR